MISTMRRPDTVRLVTWNCNGGFERGKYDRLLALNPDIAVISEACDEARLLRAKCDAHSSYAWIGRFPYKGLAVIGFGPYKIRAHMIEWDQRLEWILPTHVRGPADFNLIGVWSMNRRATIDHVVAHAVVQPQQALDTYRALLAARPTVFAGDFNHHPVFDRPDKTERRFDSMLDAFRRNGLVSAYHAVRAVDHGCETEETHWWRRSQDTSFHIDYAFVPDAWTPATSVEIGSFDQWCTRDTGSDHAPIVIDVDLATIEQGTAA